MRSSSLIPSINLMNSKALLAYDVILMFTTRFSEYYELSLLPSVSSLSVFYVNYVSKIIELFIFADL